MAGTPFRTARNIELSLLYYLQTNLSVDWVGASVVKTFKEAYHRSTDLPIVTARLSSTNSTRRELGSTTLENRHLLIIDIFAKSDAMRLDLSDYIRDKIKNGWVHYDWSHASGSNVTMSRTENGKDLITSFLTDQRIDFVDATDTKDKYRHEISFLVKSTSE